MKKKIFKGFTMIWLLFCVSCSIPEGSITTNDTEVTVNPVEIKTATVEPTMTWQLTSEPTKEAENTLTTEIIIPEAVEFGLENLLRTNGDCVGQCIAGVQIAEMNLQEIQNVMSQWGTIRMFENEEGFLLNLEKNTVYDRVFVTLIVVLTTQDEKVDVIRLEIKGISEDYLGLEGGIWNSESEILDGYEVKTLVNSYGIPDDIYIYFSSYEDWRYNSVERNEIIYYLGLFYQEYNFVVFIEGLTYVENYSFEICPAEDSHNLNIDYNPEASFDRIQENTISWHDLTGDDPEKFYSFFMDEDNPCFSSTIDEVLELQPWFH